MENSLIKYRVRHYVMSDSLSVTLLRAITVSTSEMGFISVFIIGKESNLFEQFDLTFHS